MKVLTNLIFVSILFSTVTSNTVITAQVSSVQPHTALSTNGAVDNEVLRALSNPLMQSGGVTSVPAGYGRYCSIVYDTGAWAFSLLPGQKSDPCADLLKSSPGGTIMRAGLWSVKGNNNVMLRCEGGGVGLWREKGDKPAKDAFKSATGQRFCIFVMSPTRLPIFTAPYGKTTLLQISPHADVVVTNTHNFNLYQIPVNVRDFGQTPSPNHPDAHTFDRKGRQLCRLGTRQQCCPDPNNADTCRPANCHINPSHGGYDWVMPEGKPLRSVAAGRVVMERSRDVSKFNCGNTNHEKFQKEVYIRHTVGSGGYDESFITYYAHLSDIDVKTGDVVTAGQKIGEAGDTGCSSQSHLHFGVARLSNTSGFSEYPYATTGDCGDNSFPVTIDPFGWSAPKNIDPFAWLPLGNRHTDCTGGKVANPGAFSIYLWQAGAAPPNKN